MERYEHMGRSIDAEHADLRVRLAKIELLLDALAGRDHGLIDEARASEGRLFSTGSAGSCRTTSPPRRPWVCSMSLSQRLRVSRGRPSG